MYDMFLSILSTLQKCFPTYGLWTTCGLQMSYGWSSKISVECISFEPHILLCVFSWHTFKAISYFNMYHVLEYLLSHCQLSLKLLMSVCLVHHHFTVLSLPCSLCAPCTELTCNLQCCLHHSHTPPLLSPD